MRTKNIFIRILVLATILNVVSNAEEVPPVESITFPGSIGGASFVSGEKKSLEEILSPNNALNQRSPFEEEKLYTILALPLVPTQIVLHPDETFTGLYMGDTQRWTNHVLSDNVFIKPTVRGISTLAKLVTTKRTYSLLLISGEAGDKYHYRVAWDYPSIVAQEAARAELAVLQKRVDEAVKQRMSELEREKEIEENVIVQRADLIESMYSEYAFDGAKSIQPQLIMDDGTKTYMLFASPELPAIYAIDGDEEILPNFNPNPRGGFITVDRAADKWKFVLGTKKATAKRNAKLEQGNDQ